MKKVANTAREYIELHKTNPQKVKFIRTRSDWQKLTSLPITSKRHPLYGCSPKVVAEFEKKLQFNKKGMTTLVVHGVTAELSYKRFIDLLGLFGIGPGLFDDFLMDYRCRGPGDCVKDNTCACSPNC